MCLNFIQVLKYILIQVGKNIDMVCVILSMEDIFMLLVQLQR